MIKYLLPLIILLTGCHRPDPSHSIVSMQILDRNGFAETISNQERLKVYQNVNFLTAQPYEKVLRVYGKDGEGKSHSKITSYHDTGGIWQYLEALDGRAHGRFLEWHPNGRVKIEATVIEGLADFSLVAQKSWLFDGPCSVWDEQGNLEAEFSYEIGELTDNATYYFPSSQIQRIIPYKRGLIHGTLREFDEGGAIVKSISFQSGKNEGEAFAKWSSEHFQYRETYRDGLLISGKYYDSDGVQIAEIENGQGIRAFFQEGRLYSLSTYKDGSLEGEVRIFDLHGFLQTSYNIKNGEKTGEEWEYYPSLGDDQTPKLLVNWHEGEIQGIVKTWYDTGVLESQREMSHNLKHGFSFAYYRNGDLMMMEEYEHDKLVKGSYFKMGEKHPVSEILQGDGIATFYNPEGHFKQKVAYGRGKPILDSL